MPFMPDELEQFQEQRAAPKNRYPLRIVSAQKRETKDKSDQGGNPSRPMWAFGFKIENDEDNLYSLVNLSIIDMEPGDRGYELQGLTAKRLSHYFGIPLEVFGKPWDQFDANDFLNASADDMPVDKDDFGSKLQLPRLPEEY